MLRLWLAQRKSLPTSACAWKQPGSIYWLWFRALDRMRLQPAEIPQRLLHQLFELDADYAETLWALDQRLTSLDLQAMLRDTLAALEQLPKSGDLFRAHLPRRAQATLAQLEITVRSGLDSAEAYSMVPGRSPRNG